MAQEIVEVPLTGKVIEINVKPGDTVKEEDTLCVIESMKMENPIVATIGGTIAKIGVAVGQVVKPGDVIAVIEYQ